jgi:hypothetical protein
MTFVGDMPNDSIIPTETIVSVQEVYKPTDDVLFISSINIP